MDKFLQSRQLKRAHYAFTPWLAEVPAGTTLEDILKPSFWGVVSGDIASSSGQRGRHDVITVVSEDGLIDVDLRVVQTGERMVSVRLIRQSPAAGEIVAEVPADKELPRVEFVPGRGNGWRVLDLHGAVYVEKIEGKDKALLMLDQYRAEHRIAA